MLESNLNVGVTNDIPDLVSSRVVNIDVAPVEKNLNIEGIESTCVDTEFVPGVKFKFVNDLNQ